MSWKRWLIAAGSFAAAIGVSVYLVWYSWRQAGTIAMLPVSGHLLAATAMLLELVARAVKFQLVAASLRVHLPFSAAIRTCLGGDFAAGITPSRTAGEPARFLVLTEAKIGATSAVLLLFAELFLEMASVLVVAIIFAMVFRGSGAVVESIFGVAGAYAALVLVVGVCGYRLAHRNANGPVPGWARACGIHAGRWRTVQRALRQLRTGISGLRTAKVADLVGACVTSLVHVGLRLTILPLLLFSFGVKAAWAPIILRPMALLFGGNAVPAPGGGGLIEVGFKASLGNVIPPEFFAATLVWWRFYTFYALILLGAIAAGRTVMRVLRSDGATRHGARNQRDTIDQTESSGLRAGAAVSNQAVILSAAKDRGKEAVILSEAKDPTISR